MVSVMHCEYDSRDTHSIETAYCIFECDGHSKDTPNAIGCTYPQDPTAGQLDGVASVSRFDKIIHLLCRI